MTYKLNWASAAGTLLLIAGLSRMFVAARLPRAARCAYSDTLNLLKWATLTVMAVLALAYVMNLSGQTITIGTWIAGAGGVLPSSRRSSAGSGRGDRLGHLVELAVRRPAGHRGQGRGPRPDAAGRGQLLGRRAGKMISPQNLAIGAAAVGLAGQEGDLFRTRDRMEPAALLIMCVLVYLQSTSVLSWMVV